MEHVANARSSAAQAVSTLLSPKEDGTAYSYIPFFYSRMFEHPGSERKVSWQFYGLSKGEVTTVGDFEPKLLVRGARDKRRDEIVAWLSSSSRIDCKCVCVF